MLVTRIAGSTIKELLQQAEQQLHTSDSARLDAEMLLCSITGLDRARLYACPEYIVEAHMVASFQARIRERQQGKPVAYLTGVREFWSMTFQVNAHTLVPRPETESLVETALQRIPERALCRIADLGTGSGAIALAIAKERPDCHIIATDICHEALAVAKINAIKQGIKQITFVSSDLFQSLDGSFALIVSNPPYVQDDDESLLHTDIRYEPRLALCGGADGLKIIRQIICKAGRHLEHNGWLCIEHGYDQGQAVRGLFSENGFVDVITINDYAGLERVSCGRYEHV